MRACLTFLRLLAKQLQLPPLPPFEINVSLSVLFCVHDEMVKEGGMNWGRMMYFLRLAEEFQLSEDDWDELFEFLMNHHPNYFSVGTSLMNLLFQALPWL